MVVTWSERAQVGPGIGPDAALVLVYDLEVLASPRRPRVTPPRVAVELVHPGRHLVVGRRGSPERPEREPDGDGVNVERRRRRARSAGPPRPTGEASKRQGLPALGDQPPQHPAMPGAWIGGHGTVP